MSGGEYMYLKIKILVLLLFSVSWSFAGSLESLVTYLASDQLEGRKPGQLGNKLATQFLENEFRKQGLRPLGKSFLQQFTIFTQMQKQGENNLKVKGQSIAFEPISYSLNGTLIEKELVFAGFGISIPSHDPGLHYDDYENVDVKDKIVVVFTGDPGIGNAHSQFRKPEYQNYGSLFYKLKNAISKGAKALVLIQNPLSLTQYPQEEAPYFNFSEGGGSRFSILAGKTTNIWLNSLLEQSGLSTKEIQLNIAKNQNPMSFSLKHKASVSINLKKLTGRVSNIVAVKRGSDPILSKEIIVLGAHMDHLGLGGEASLDPQGEAKIHNGADDNASGTALVLKLSQELKNIETKRSFVFVLFNAEEIGLLGSQHFIDTWERYEVEYGKIQAMLNFDMIGRYQTAMTIMGVGSSKAWPKMITRPSNSDFKLAMKKSLVGSSDHAPFINKKIPSLFFTTGAHEDYHRSTDTAEKINFKAMKRLNIYALKLVQKLDSYETIDFNPHFSTIEPGDRNRGYGAHLGCVPEFGQPDTIVGVVCMRSSKDSPAMIAGILPGDVLIQIGTIEVKNVYDLAFALKYYRAGDKIAIVWKRGETLHKQMVTLAKSKR